MSERSASRRPLDVWLGETVPTITILIGVALLISAISHGLHLWAGDSGVLRIAVTAISVYVGLRFIVCGCRGDDLRTLRHARCRTCGAAPADEPAVD